MIDGFGRHCIPLLYFWPMPLELDIQSPENARVGVWKISEPAAFFAERLSLSEAETAHVGSLNPVRTLDWLASRFVLDQIIDHTSRIETRTLSSGKPYLVGRDEQISLSHSDDYVAAMIGYTDVGVDIQRCKEKIVSVEHKFARPEESSRIDRSNEITHLHVLWSAKEALYKIYARKQLNFTRHLYVDLPTILEPQGRFTGIITTAEEELHCVLYYLILKNYVLVYGQKIS